MDVRVMIFLVSFFLCSLSGYPVWISKFNNRPNEGFENSVKENFNATGDRFWISHFINHGNQPNMQAAYLFNYSGKPWLTQKWSREIMNRYFGASTLHGWPGDEDEGQMGAWFVIETKNNSAEKFYIQSARLNGETLNSCMFKFIDIVKGGKLVLEMGHEPNKEWGNEL